MKWLNHIGYRARSARLSSRRLGSPLCQRLLARVGAGPHFGSDWIDSFYEIAGVLGGVEG